MGSSQCTAASSASATNAKGTCPMMTAANGKGSCNMATAANAKGKGTCSTAANAKGTCNAATAVHASGCCGAHSATATAAGARCDMHANTKTACSVCTDESACDGDMHTAGAHAQVVALRNGAMIVYTAETPESVRALQAALARHNEVTMAALAANGGANLCGGCKSFRGAMASGKFSRELVNVKTGAQVLLTSSDREIVQRIHDMTVASAARTKS